MKLGRIVLVLALGCAQLGCSFMYVKSPPSPGDENFGAPGELVCSRRPVAPVVDLVVADGFVGGIFTGLMLMAQAELIDSSWEKQAGLAVLTASAVLASVYTASAIWGFSATSKCRLYTRQQQNRLSDWAPAPLRPPHYHGSGAP